MSLRIRMRGGIKLSDKENLDLIDSLFEELSESEEILSDASCGCSGYACGCFGWSANPTNQH